MLIDLSTSVESMKIHRFESGKDLTLDRDTAKDGDRVYCVRLVQWENPSTSEILAEAGPFETYEAADQVYNMIMEAR